MPSTTSSSVSRLFASSTVITPSLPTFSIALAIISPTSVSPLADTTPTCRTSLCSLIGFERLLRSSTTLATATSMPRLRSIGFMPAATALAPSRTMVCASTVAVVVPSPAWSPVLTATSLTICAPMFSNLSASSTSLATVTPSLVMRGAPNALSSTTLRPLGPSVTRTASARTSTPRSMRERASAEKRTSLAAMFRILLDFLSWDGRSGGLLLRRRGALEDTHDVRLLHDQELFAVDLDLGPGPLAEEDRVADLDVELHEVALLVARPRSDGEHLALHRLFLGGVGNDDPAGRLLILVDATHDHAVVQRTKLHRDLLRFANDLREISLSVSTLPSRVLRR